MHHKTIKLIVRKQLKKQYPHWSRFSRKEKKEITRKVLSDIVADYDFNQAVEEPREALLGLQQQMPTTEIIKNEELQFVDQLLDYRIINCLLANEGV